MRKMREVANQQQGLYRPEFEHDNCGIGAVVNIKGKKTHDCQQHCSRQDHPAGFQPFILLLLSSGDDPNVAEKPIGKYDITEIIERQDQR